MPGLLELGVIGGVIAAGWRYVKLAWTRLASLVIVRAHIVEPVAAEMLLYLRQRMRCTPLNPRRFMGCYLYNRRIADTTLVPLEDLGAGGALFRDGWRAIWVTRDAPQEQGTQSPSPAAQDGIHVTFLRGVFNIERLLEAVCLTRTAQLAASGRAVNYRDGQSRFAVVYWVGSRGGADARGEPTKAIAGVRRIAAADRICRQWRPIGCDWGDLADDPTGGDSSLSPFAFLAYDDPPLEVVAELRVWLRQREWYRRRRIPWRRGYALLGPPGTGKSSFIRACGEELGLPVHILDLASMTNRDLIAAWAEIAYSLPCIIAIEDIGAVFHGRDNATSRDGASMALTFDCLLNQISGVSGSDGRVLFVTDNGAKDMHPALADCAQPDRPSRPGRIDRIIRFESMSEACRQKVALIVLGGDPAAVESAVANGIGDTAAQFHQRCIALAMRQAKGTNDA